VITFAENTNKNKPPKDNYHKSSNLHNLQIIFKLHF